MRRRHRRDRLRVRHVEPRKGHAGCGAAAATSASLTPVAVTRWPASASATAAARPMPRAPPVTIAWRGDEGSDMGRRLARRSRAVKAGKRGEDARFGG